MKRKRDKGDDRAREMVGDFLQVLTTSGRYKIPRLVSRHMYSRKIIAGFEWSAVQVWNLAIKTCGQITGNVQIVS
jgi:hypothetical protein